MLLKQFSIPLHDIRIKNPEFFNELTSRMSNDLNSSASQRKRSFSHLENEKDIIRESMSAYQEMIEKNKMEKLAFLETLKMNEVKAGLVEFVEKKKLQTDRKKIENCNRTSPPLLRRSRQLENIDIDSIITAHYDGLKKPEETPRTTEEVISIPPELSFKEALECEDLYENYKVDMNIKELKHEKNFTVYDKSVLGKMTVSESNIVKVFPHSAPIALAWYPSPEQMIIAAGDKYGQLGIWNVESGNPYVFTIHLDKITNLQFNLFNETQLITSSDDGILRCGDIVKENFSEIYNVSGETSCTYFDVLSATTYLVAQKNGQVALVDKRTRSNSWEKKHECHDYSIKTLNIHPTNRNYFTTADEKGSIRIWDLRELQSAPVADIIHYKRCVYSAFFSPVTGNSILATSFDSISIFDVKDLSCDIKVRAQMKLDPRKFSAICRASWLPNSEEIFMVGSRHPRSIEVYDKNMFLYCMMSHEYSRVFTQIYAFHPSRPALVTANMTYRKTFLYGI